LQEDERTCKADGELENAYITAAEFVSVSDFDMNLSSISLGGEATLIFSSKMEIRGIHLDSQIYFSVVKNLNNSHSVAIDGDYIYWSQSTHGNQMIMKMLMGIEDKKENVVRMGKRFIKNYNSDISFFLRCKEM